MFKDPVCGMVVENQVISSEIEGKKFFFCSQGCKDQFENSPDKFSQQYLYDLVIIGGGPAGLTAAVYASISRIDTFLITNDIGGQAIDSTKIKNYMGFDFITGGELTQKFKDQFLQEHYLIHKIDEVLGIKSKGKNFEIFTKSGMKVFSKTIIIATGMKKRKLGILGEDRLQRKGISYSSVQDITLFSGMDVVVIGGGNSGVQTANDLKRICRSVTLISKGNLIADQKDIDALKEGSKVKILDKHDVVEIKGEEKVEGVVVKPEEGGESKDISCGGVFIQVGFLPNTEFCQGLVDLNENGEIIINHDCSTNVDGVFACGDVTSAFGKRIVIASGEGAKATLSARKYLAKRNG